MIADLLAINHKINIWHFREIDMPALGIELPEGATSDDVVGGDDAILSGLALLKRSVVDTLSKGYAKKDRLP